MAIRGLAITYSLGTCAVRSLPNCPLICRIITSDDMSTYNHFGLPLRDLTKPQLEVSIQH